MAEDEALEAAAEAAKVAIEKIDARLAEGVSRDRIMAELSALTNDDARPQISSGENRVGPGDPSDADQAQDAADEKAEAARNAEKAGSGPTHETLRQLAGEFQKMVGMAAAVKAIPAIVGAENLAAVPDDKIEQAAAALRAAIESAAATGKPATDTTAEQSTATRQDVIDKMMEYGRKFDGAKADPSDPTSMPFTYADCPKIFQLLFGGDTARLSQIPDDPISYGKVVSAIDEAIEKDPFKRGGVA